MKTAIEILKDCFLGLIDFNEEAALSAMKRYAEQKCAEQRQICQTEFDKNAVYSKGKWYISCEDVINSKPPKFD